MNKETLHINNPSKNLLELVRKLQYEKNKRQEELKREFSKYFPKK